MGLFLDRYRSSDESFSAVLEKRLSNALVDFIDANCFALGSARFSVFCLFRVSSGEVFFNMRLRPDVLGLCYWREFRFAASFDMV